MSENCDQCGGPFQGIIWGDFTANGKNLGDICEACRCAVMADYITPSAIRVGDEWHATYPDPPTEDA